MKYVFNRYVLLILSIFLAIGIPATFFFTNLVSGLLIEGYENSTVALVETEYKKTISTVPITEPVSGQEREKIDSFVDELRLKVKLQEVNIWALDGTLVYSSIPSEPIGEKTELAGDFAESLRDKTVSGVERRGDPEVKGGGVRVDVLEVYFPIHHQAEIVNIFEIYAPLDPINVLIARARELITGLFAILFIVVAVTGQIGAVILARKDQRLNEQERSETALRQKDRDIRKAYSEVLEAVTAGKLIILSPEEMQGALGKECGEIHRISSYATLAIIRESLGSIMRGCGLEKDLIEGMVLAADEAMANGVKHAGECELQVFSLAGMVQVKVSDHGPGIDFSDLPKAALMAGFSSKKSLGVGFTLILGICDRVLLSTGAEGTTLILETGGKKEAEGFEDILRRE